MDHPDTPLFTLGSRIVANLPHAGLPEEVVRFYMSNSGLIPEALRRGFLLPGEPLPVDVPPRPAPSEEIDSLFLRADTLMMERVHNAIMTVCDSSGPSADQKNLLRDLGQQFTRAFIHPTFEPMTRWSGGIGGLVRPVFVPECDPCIEMTHIYMNALIYVLATILKERGMNMTQVSFASDHTLRRPFDSRRRKDGWFVVDFGDRTFTSDPLVTAWTKASPDRFAGIEVLWGLIENPLYAAYLGREVRASGVWVPAVSIYGFDLDASRTSSGSSFLWLECRKSNPRYELMMTTSPSHTVTGHSIPTIVWDE